MAYIRDFSGGIKSFVILNILYKPLVCGSYLFIITHVRFYILLIYDTQR